MTHAIEPPAAAPRATSNARYPRGFYYGPNPPPEFKASPFRGLFHERKAERSHAVFGDAEVAVLGSCFDVVGSDKADAATRLALELARSPDAFFAALDRQAGRHVVFFRTPTLEGVLGDATGCRTIFYDQEAIASHTGMLSDAAPDQIPFARGFPGNWTPVPGVRILTPNTFKALSSQTVSRFWPKAAPDPIDLDEACRRIEAHARNALQQGPRLALGLTAGIDSRTVAVAAWKAGVDLLTFTYDRGPHTHNDIAVARQVAERLGFEHVTVLPSKPSKRMRVRLKDATYYNHHFNCVEPLAEALDGRAVATGHLLEIGRVFYGQHRRHGRDLSTPDQMAAHYFDSLRRTAQAQIDEYGRDQWMAIATQAFAEFDEKTGFQTAAGLIDPFDLFYWEHRMGTWQSLILLERDFYAEPYMPFNCRAVFAAMLGLPREVREEAALFFRLTDTPELADVPVTSSSTAAISSAAKAADARPKKRMGAKPKPWHVRLRRRLKRLFTGRGSVA